MTDPGSKGGVHYVRWQLARTFAIDTRSLAAFRISLGAVLLVDLVWRSFDLAAFYTDDGVLPRDVMFSVDPSWYAVLMPHNYHGSFGFQAVLFVVAASAAAALALGVRTKAANLACLFLTVSLHSRNPLVGNAGDELLVFLLFWGLFLPLGERWSVDSLRVDEPREEVSGLASAALLLQVVLVYFHNAWFKLQGDTWLDGSALLYVLHMDTYTTWFGDLLATVPVELIALLNYLWLALLTASVLLLVFKGWLRTLLASLFAVMHVGMLMSISLAVFPLVSVTGLLPFFGGGFWNALEERLEEVEPPVPDLLERMAAPGWTAVPGSLPDDVRTVVVLVLVAALLMGNVSALGLATPPEQAEPVVEPFEASWSLFAPDPSIYVGWSVVPGELESGEEHDVYHLTEASWNETPDSRHVDHARWRTYKVDVITAGNQELRPPWADWVCERWNARHGDEVESLELHRVLVNNPVHHEEIYESYHRYDHDCR